jgi:hypothetical protein
MPISWGQKHKLLKCQSAALKNPNDWYVNVSHVLSKNVKAEQICYNAKQMTLNNWKFQELNKLWRNAHIAVLPPNSYATPSPTHVTGISAEVTSARCYRSVQTRRETRQVSHQQVRLVQRVNSFVFSVVTGTAAVEWKSTKWTINDVGEVSTPPSIPPPIQ